MGKKPMVVWNGTGVESRDFMIAIGHHCTCKYENGTIKEKCELHVMMLSDQRWLDHLIFLKRLGERALEWDVPPAADQ